MNEEYMYNRNRLPRCFGRGKAASTRFGCSSDSIGFLKDGVNRERVACTRPTSVVISVNQRANDGRRRIEFHFEMEKRRSAVETEPKTTQFDSQYVEQEGQLPPRDSFQRVPGRRSRCAEP